MIMERASAADYIGPVLGLIATGVAGWYLSQWFLLDVIDYMLSFFAEIHVDRTTI
jgi:hypothetical protein